MLREENFGDLITADHKIFIEGERGEEGRESNNSHRYAVSVGGRLWFSRCDHSTGIVSDTNDGRKKFWTLLPDHLDALDRRSQEERTY